MAEPRVVVGLDFGTTFSGFAFTQKADPDNIHIFYEWPMQTEGGGKPYSKTPTSLYYARKSGMGIKSSDLEFELKDWGWPAPIKYLQALQTASKSRRLQAGDIAEVQQEEHYLVREFKLHLASVCDKPGLGELKEKKDDEKKIPCSEWHKNSDKFEGKTSTTSSELKENKSKNKSEGNGIGLWKSFEGIRNRVLKAVLSLSKKVQDENLTQDGSQLLPSLYNGHNELPPGVTVHAAITDYLRSIADFVMSHLQSTYGKHISKKEVQWCLTVPAIWDEQAKYQMRYCAQRAGIVTGPYCPSEMADAASPFKLMIVLESEAASVYCIKKAKQLSLEDGPGAQFVVADLGGGTADIMVHEVMESATGLKLKAVKPSTGDLCGATFVDTNFMNFLSRKIGCLPEFVKENPVATASMLRRWEDVKCSFDGTLTSGVEFELPTKLAKAWQMHEASCRVGWRLRWPTRESYDEIEITNQDMLHIFDPVVDKILSLIQDQMSPSIQALMMVGGFSSSPYLMKRVHQAFSKQVKNILCPPDPGSAICQGAVVLGVSPDIIMTRSSRKTYCLRVVRPFEEGRHRANLHYINSDGKAYCKAIALVVLPKGVEVSIDQCEERLLFPTVLGQKSLGVKLYSTDDPSPQFTCDPGMKLEGSFSIDISQDDENLELGRRVCCSVYFGRSHIQVRAKRINFGNTSEVFELDNIEFSKAWTT